MAQASPSPSMRQAWKFAQGRGERNVPVGHPVGPLRVGGIGEHVQPGQVSGVGPSVDGPELAGGLAFGAFQDGADVGVSAGPFQAPDAEVHRLYAPRDSRRLP